MSKVNQWRYTLHAEDSAQRLIIDAIIQCHFPNMELQKDPLGNVAVNTRNRGSRVVDDAKAFIAAHGEEIQQDGRRLTLIAVDGNCSGHLKKRKEVLSRLSLPSALIPTTVLAVPEPHIERWLLLDSAAFKAVLGRGCAAPDQKCEKDRYKQLLRGAVKDATNTNPALGGLEYAAEVIENWDLPRTREPCESLDAFIAGVESVVR